MPLGRSCLSSLAWALGTAGHSHLPRLEEAPVLSQLSCWRATACGEDPAEGLGQQLAPSFSFHPFCCHFAAICHLLPFSSIYSRCSEFQSPVVYQLMPRLTGQGEAHPAQGDTLSPLVDAVLCPVPGSQLSLRLLPPTTDLSTPRNILAPSLSLLWPPRLHLPLAFLEEHGTCAEEPPLSTTTELHSG